MSFFTIVIDPALENRGHSGGIVFRSDEGCVSMCSTNEGGLPKLPVLILDYDKLDFRIIAGAKDCTAWEDLFLAHRKEAGWKDIALDFMFNLLLRNLTRDLLEQILSRSYKTGFKDGREDKRLEFVKVFER